MPADKPIYTYRANTWIYIQHRANITYVDIYTTQGKYYLCGYIYNTGQILPMWIYIQHRANINYVDIFTTLGKYYLHGYIYIYIHTTQGKYYLCGYIYIYTTQGKYYLCGYIYNTGQILPVWIYIQHRANITYMDIYIYIQHRANITYVDIYIYIQHRANITYVDIYTTQDKYYLCGYIYNTGQIPALCGLLCPMARSH